MFNLQKVRYVLFASSSLFTLFNKSLALRCKNRMEHVDKSLEETEEFVNVTVRYKYNKLRTSKIRLWRLLQKYLN
jgi:hypothetical protein